MRIPHLGKTQITFIALFALVAISLLTAGSAPNPFTKKDAAFYSDPASLSFARPGLAVKVVAGGIDSSGVMTATIKIVDGKGIALDPTGTTTPGAVPVACTMAVIPKGTNEFVSYTPFPATSPTDRKSVV
jgi:hypothetical protein